MADFLLAQRKVLKNEGFYSDDPTDPGGETVYGIARKKHPDWIGWSVVDSYKGHQNFPAILSTLQGIISSVNSFYKVNFWNPIRGNDIYKQEVAESIYDSSVNMGVSTAIKLAQRTLGLHETGTMDQITLNKLNNEGNA